MSWGSAKALQYLVDLDPRLVSYVNPLKELPSVENTISELAAEGIRDEITREDVFHGSTAAFHCGNGPTITKVHDHEIAWARQSLETHYSPLHISCYTHDIGIRPNPSSSLGASENRQSIAKFIFGIIKP
ncbi:hypothetical protein FG05_13732 [Fusarium graminearum]|nr:hypothetical protein FG05_13732 [Fusarium graminearum]